MLVKRHVKSTSCPPTPSTRSPRRWHACAVGVRARPSRPRRIITPTADTRVTAGAAVPGVAVRRPGPTPRTDASVVPRACACLMRSSRHPDRCRSERSPRRSESTNRARHASSSSRSSSAWWRGNPTRTTHAAPACVSPPRGRASCPDSAGDDGMPFATPSRRSATPSGWSSPACWRSSPTPGRATESAASSLRPWAALRRNRAGGYSRMRFRASVSARPRRRSGVPHAPPRR